MSKKKLVLSLIAVTFILLGSVSYYLLAVKEYAIDDEKLSEMVESEYKIDLPDDFEEEPLEEIEGDTTEEPGEDRKNTPGTEEAADTDGATATTVAGSVKKEANHTKTDSQSVEKKKTNTSVSDKKSGAAKYEKPKIVSANVIIDRYVASFADLEAQANDRINALVEYAQNDYQTKKQNGQDVSYVSFYTKYSTAGRTIEKNTDTAFQTIYSSLVETLKEYGHDESKAEHIKDHYEQSKKERRNAIINKAKAYL